MERGRRGRVVSGQPRHFLSLLDASPEELAGLIERAVELKAMQRAGRPHAPLAGRVLGMLFEKSSTRTRVSFEVGMLQLGGHAIFLSPQDTQLGRGEPIEDTARVLSRMVDAAVVRTFAHEKLERFAAHSIVPVINALTDRFHPCQLLADVHTVVEHLGAIKGVQVAWVGDGNNMCHSYINAAARFGFDLRVACPPGYEPDPAVIEASGADIRLVRDPREAVRGAEVVVTDVWASMGQESEQAARVEAFSGYQVDAALLARADSKAIVLHCLPAHRDEEISAEVLEGPRSVVWDEAENRLHAQKALLEWLLAR
jgi:ornithine carbamoyltransferase